MMRPQKKIERLLSNISITFITLTILFLTAEVITRLYFHVKPYRGTSEVKESDHIVRPYVMSVADPSLIGINSLGYKGKLPEMPKPTNEVRIMLLGGSTVYSEAAEGEKALPGLIEEILQKKFSKQVRVYNFGITSTVTLQELTRLVVDISNFEPDLVISYGGGNDLIRPSISPGTPHRFIFYEVNPLWETDVSKYPTFHLLLFGSKFLRILFRDYFEKYFMKRSTKRKFFANGVPFYSDPPIHYAETIIKMSVISNAFGAKFCAFLQPLRDYYYYKNISQKNRIDDWISKSVTYLKQSGKKVDFEVLMDQFPTITSGQWADAIHLKAEANREIARRLSLEIEERIIDLL